MREILFRGKGFNDEWEYGVPVFSGLNNELAFMKQMHSYDHQVFPETIGQYTGLTDKNGKKIFEGDILSERPLMNQIAYVGYVAYDEELAVWRFMIKNDERYNGVLLGSYSNSYTVMGNIHDNPELLEGESDESD